jgi:hypothetical protein
MEETMTPKQIETEKKRIDAMTQLEMCRLYRFAPCGHPYFLTGTELHRYFRKRFDAVGGFTPEISKAIG